MPAPRAQAKLSAALFSVRRRVNRKILCFSLLMGLFAALLTVFVYIASAYPQVRRSTEANLRTLSEIRCTGATCDTSAYTMDWQSSGSDYVVDVQTRYLIDVPTPSVENPGRFPPLDYFDTARIARFRQPDSLNAPDGEVWRLYSREVNAGSKNFEIIIGYAEKAPWKMVDTPRSSIAIVDAKLKAEANKIAASLPGLEGAAFGAGIRLSADGFAVVDAKTRQLVHWGPWLPAYLPQDKPLPTPGYQLCVSDGDLYLVRTDTNGRLVTTSLIPLGGLWLLATLCATAFLATGVVAWTLSRRSLRSYFAMTGIRVPTVEEALRAGEGQRVEFKRGLSEDEGKTGAVEDEVLRSIAAFANTNDGVMFIGVDDAGHVKGLALDFRQKDRFEQKIRQLVRNRIKPAPPFQVTFEDVRGLLVANITVARGEAPVYMELVRFSDDLTREPPAGAGGGQQSTAGSVREEPESRWGAVIRA